jgi:hypothetical protein
MAVHEAMTHVVQVTGPRPFEIVKNASPEPSLTVWYHGKSCKLSDNFAEGEEGVVGVKYFL